MRYLATTLTCLVVAAGTVGVLFEAADSPGQLAPIVFLGELGVFIGLYVQILFHEIGHFVAGKRAGMIFQQMTVGPIGVRRTSGRTKIYLTRRMPMGGFIYMSLPETCEAAKCLRVMIAGGPLASIVVFLAFSACFSFALRGREPTTIVFFGGLLVGSAFVLSSLLPYSPRGNHTDMMMLRKLRSPGPERDRVVAAFMLTKEMFAGVRPRDWTESALRPTIATSENEVDDLRARVLAYYHYADKGDALRARESIDQALAIVGGKGGPFGPLGDLVWAAGAFVAADVDRDADMAQARLEKATSKAEDLDYSKFVARAAIALLEKDFASAKQNLNDAERALAKSERRGMGSVQMERETIARLRASMPN